MYHPNEAVPLLDQEANTSTSALVAPLPQDSIISLKSIAGISYFIAYLYCATLFGSSTAFLFWVVLAFVALVEFAVRRLNSSLTVVEMPQSPSLETWIFMVATLAQALAISLWGFYNEWVSVQFLAVHACFILYVIARNGWLHQQRIGLLSWMDFLRYGGLAPFRNFFLRRAVIRYKTAKKESADNATTKANHIKSALFIVGTVVITGVLVTFAWEQLIQVSDKFAALSSTIQTTLSQWFSIDLLYFVSDDVIGYFILSLPVGMWLFALVAGNIIAPPPQYTYQQFQDSLIPWRFFPRKAAYIIIGGLCFTYGLFFAVALSELGTLLSVQPQDVPISAENASLVAVSGFWQLVNVSLMNFGLLVAFYLFANQPLWDEKGTRFALTVLFSSTTLFALLAGWKLFGIYMYVYGPTPLRLLSGWFILVLLVWCVLILIRFYKPIHAIRIGVLYTVISFTLFTYIYAIVIR